MAMNRPGKSAIVLSSAPLQLLLYLTGVYYVFYFLSTLGMLIYKSRVLSYPGDNLTLEVCLLFLMAGLEMLRLYSGMRGNLQEREGYVGINMVLTVPTVMLSVYFLIWQTYVLRADVIVNALLLSMYGLGGLLAFITLARFTSAYT
ncbi:transmembrane protein 216 isoform X1 [Osmerus eperlanus]|uniref:transmembrane protein 216 isoform X1 n=1 Tax=Osmerus eperlanus TaxID=29151 RepID=UPI002E0D42B0